MYIKGKEPTNNNYVGGTIIFDQESIYVHVQNQVGLTEGTTHWYKKAFDPRSDQFGVNFKGFLVYNVHFVSVEFIRNVKDKNQTIYFYVSGAHQQNVVAKRSIQTITCWYCSMLSCEIIMWSTTERVGLWPFALKHAACL